MVDITLPGINEVRLKACSMRVGGVGVNVEGLLGDAVEEAVTERYRMMQNWPAIHRMKQRLCSHNKVLPCWGPQ